MIEWKNRIKAYFPPAGHVTTMEITVHARPKARIEDIQRDEDGTYVIHVREPPDKGKANKAIIKVISRHFNVPVSKVSITRGATSSTKVIRIDDDHVQA